MNQEYIQYTSIFIAPFYIHLLESTEQMTS